MTALSAYFNYLKFFVALNDLIKVRLWSWDTDGEITPVLVIYSKSSCGSAANS